MYPGLKINLHKSYCTFMTVSQFFPIPLYYGLQMAKKKKKRKKKTIHKVKKRYFISIYAL